MPLALDDIDRVTSGKIGTFDVACPVCGPERRSGANQKRKVLRIWRIAPAFATYRCARCDLHGYAREDGAPRPDAAEIAKARSEAQQFGAAAAEGKRQKARWLWARRRSAEGTIAETYLRAARRYGGPLPATLGFLPSRTGFPPAMISAFGVADDWEAAPIGAAIKGVHLTRLSPDGSGKAGTDADKIMIGAPRGTPIVLAPINDGLGLAITEGIEDGLSIFEATGLGAWAAGSAPFLPALADVVPAFVEAVSVIADPDEAGQCFARDLAIGLHRRRIGHRVLVWRDQRLRGVA
jgi:hypothetical protein